ncbi:hypothetical protein HO173_005695 [Letharia columbiana]|uniref:Uncharacterized protein n=1 Tax=Letharia columbiana TaxID=112416 RepID=A0A8H6FWN3_9LECA|nr:uncharacterized protein HO173_005695 [Letharia columbiana]KAF6236067.1 hypothetical protein HO173_005695 [Letharia columbiana]
MSVGSNIFAVDGTSYRKGASGKLVFGTMTLPPGSEITPSGHVIPVGSSSAVVDGTSYTWAAPASSPTSTPASENIGGLIILYRWRVELAGAFETWTAYDDDGDI